MPAWISPNIRNMMGRGLDIPVYVETIGSEYTSAITDVLFSQGIELVNITNIVPGVAASMSDNLIDFVAKMKGVKAVWLDFTVTGLMDEAAAAVAAPFAWQYSTGSGVVVAVIDTGIDANHPALRGTVVGFEDLVNGRTQPYDDNGHGTHVSGIIASRSKEYPGISRGNLFGIKALDAGGAGLMSVLIPALEFCSNEPIIQVVNMSVGGFEFFDNGNHPLSQAADILSQDGIPVCVAAGNSGPIPYSLMTPGKAHDVITVGAVDNRGNPAFFSSRSGIGFLMKPDVAAPGVQIMAPQANSDGFIPQSGTSMSCPIVAGIVALMVDLNPSISPLRVKAILQKAVQTDGQPFITGKGMVHALDAVESV